MTPERAAEILNRIHVADPSVLPAIIGHRVPCNAAVAHDPAVQVGVTRTDGEVGTEGYEVGFMGILNGMLGVDADGAALIAAVMSSTAADATLVRFDVLRGRH